MANHTAKFAKFAASTLPFKTVLVSLTLKHGRYCQTPLQNFQRDLFHRPVINLLTCCLCKIGMETFYHFIFQILYRIA